mmetsp:Transcript_10903/g.15915  ORF Transcript_10903/g.15915 Transcript_10903/m.15915 type:complete len:266 (-) Transcript_10903:180-977(-)
MMRKSVLIEQPQLHQTRLFGTSPPTTPPDPTMRQMGMFAVASAVAFGAYYTAYQQLMAPDVDMKKHANDNPIILNAAVTHKTYFDITIDGRPAGRIVLGLYGNIVPKTCENFLQLCQGNATGNGRAIKYEGSGFHRIIPGFMVQGGDITHHNGYGGYSIYGHKFEDENFHLKHAGPGCLSMANSGSNTNSSQFFITLTKTRHLDGRHVVFGTVLEGWDTVKLMESYGTQNGKPTKRIVISKAGVLPVEEEGEGEESSNKKEDQSD